MLVVAGFRAQPGSWWQGSGSESAPRCHTQVHLHPTSVELKYRAQRVDVAALSAGRLSELLNLVPWGGVNLDLVGLRLAGLQVGGQEGPGQRGGKGVSVELTLSPLIPLFRPFFPPCSTVLSGVGRRGFVCRCRVDPPRDSDAAAQVPRGGGARPEHLQGERDHRGPRRERKAGGLLLRA